MLILALSGSKTNSISWTFINIILNYMICETSLYQSLMWKFKMATFFRNAVRQGMFGIAIKKKTNYRVKRESNSVIKDR